MVFTIEAQTSDAEINFQSVWAGDVFIVFKCFKVFKCFYKLLTVLNNSYGFLADSESVYNVSHLFSLYVYIYI